MADVHDVEVVVGQIVPMIGTAVGAYGAGVLTRAEDEAAEATVRLGQRLLGRILHRAVDPAAVQAAVGDLAAAPDDADALAGLRLQIRKVLAADPALVAEVAGLLPARAQASGERSAAVAGDVNISTSGPNSPAAWSIGQVSYPGTVDPTVPGRPQS
jgi:hypothetical protein